MWRTPSATRWCIGGGKLTRRALPARHEAATADLVGHRRYHAVLAPLDGDLTVEVAPKAGLTCTRAYSDIDDRERFEGAGEKVVIPAGGVAVVEIDEAYRVVSDAADPRVVVLHVTVEGYSFPNK